MSSLAEREPARCAKMRWAQANQSGTTTFLLAAVFVVVVVVVIVVVVVVMESRNQGTKVKRRVSVYGPIKIIVQSP